MVYIRKTIGKYAYLAVVLFCAGRTAGAQAVGPGGAPLKLTDLPAGRFRSEIAALPGNIQTQALSRVSLLDIPEMDFEALRVHPRGKLYYICDFGGVPAPDNPHLSADGFRDVPPQEPAGFSSAVPISSPPLLHSLPGSTNVLYLDFNGALVTNTYWNSYPDFEEPFWDCRPYSIDADETTFSVAEQQAIQIIWERVAEDYAPFDIDVTTEQPLVWNRYTGHVLITPETDKNGVECPHFGAGGVAFLDVFGEPYYSYDYAGECLSPAWVLNYESAGYAEFEAEAASHEMGHNLALSHDGTKKDPYYGGHENDSIGWGPIMGTGYNRDVSQWSKGDYALSNNSEDDLAIISSHISYRQDDFGDDQLSAHVLQTGPTGSVYLAGVVEHNTDIDVFCLAADSGVFGIRVSPYRDSASATWGGNLDVVLELYDDAGVLMATNNPALETMAGLSVAVSNGVYYLHIKATGLGTPLQKHLPSGYVQYGSLGQYTITGSIAVNLDRDGDGLSNQWETDYFGDMTNAISIADSDGDGQNNLAEYIAGSDPTNEMSVFKIVDISMPATSGAPFIIAWNPIAGRIYNVGWCDELSNGGFSNLVEGLPYPQNSYTDTVDRAGSMHFYRVEVQLDL